MRTKLGRVAAFTALGVAAAVIGAGAADANTAGVAAAPSPSVDPTSTTSTSTTTTSTSTTSTSTTTSTTTAPLLVVSLATAPPLVVDAPPPGAALPSRGTSQQVTPTLPAPPTTTIPSPLALPANSGTGRRVVYSKAVMRVWVVESNEEVVKTHLVSGRRTWNQPLPGTYSVFSRSSFTCNIKNPAICWRYMVRFTKGPEGDNIGFHEIPKKNGVPVQTESQLGQALSGGCVRQATSDALYMWNWAGIGTKVVVLG